MANRGFFPCFSKYLFKEFPPENMYLTNSYVEKLKKLVSALIDSKTPYELKQNIGQEIQTIRPNSSEGKRLIKMCEFPLNLYRIDYGNNPFRVLFGLSNENRIAHIFAVDTNHSTCNGKQKR